MIIYMNYGYKIDLRKDCPSLNAIIFDELVNSFDYGCNQAIFAKLLKNVYKKANDTPRAFSEMTCFSNDYSTAVCCYVSNINFIGILMIILYKWVWGDKCKFIKLNPCIKVTQKGGEYK